jgi:hypothetical protein
MVISDQLITRNYQWTYAKSDWTWELSFRQSLYDYYKALPRYPTHNYSVYVTHPLDDKQLESIVTKLQAGAQQKGYDAFKTVSFVAAFVQSLDYTSDSVTTEFDEYPRYPVETLVDNGGDCEDTAVLLASLIDKIGYGVILIRYAATATTSGHMAVGVKGGDGINGTSFTFEGSKYYYVETTGTGWEIGQCPEEYRGVSAFLYKMTPAPILTHDWESQGKLGNIEMKVTVNNLGSAVAENVKVYAGFDAGNNQAWNGQYSPSFAVGINETWTVVLNLKPAWGEYTRLLVQIIYNGYAVDESYGQWVQLPAY